MSSFSYLSMMLWVNVAYFCCMCLAHWFGIKKPILFVYYDTAYYAYQDKIIAFCVMTYILLFTAAALHPEIVAPFAIASMWFTAAGLCAINTTGDLRRALPVGQTSTKFYWAQSVMIGGIAAVLTTLYALSL
mmetsp:Transcript_148230/g.458195  ORF Transcript_148230/g.458195 Transcript_148230/m.458195 type:complete len:132 (+) Transcript_148230:80-475(+)